MNDRVSEELLVAAAPLGRIVREGPTSIEAYAIVLAEISELARVDADGAHAMLMDVATDGIPEILKPLRSAVLRHICWAEDRQSQGRMESDLYPIFTDQHAALIPGSAIVKGARVEGHIPDFLVDVGGRIRPVEVKRGDFNVAAVRQLARYIDAHGADIGYAVAPRLTGGLQENMRFIEIAFPDEDQG